MPHMNKLSILILSLLSLDRAFAADDLSNAIKSINPTQVSLLLQKKQYTESHCSKYVRAAKKSVQLCHEDLCMQQLRPAAYGYEKLFLASLCLTVGALCYRLALDYKQTRKRNICIAITIGSMITMIVAAGLGVESQTRYLQERHNNALQIQELVLNSTSSKDQHEPK